MAGLIESGFLSGVGNAMSTYGLGTLQARERADLEARRQQADLDYRRERDAASNAARVEAAQIAADARRESAGGKGGSGGGVVAGVLSPQDRAALALGDTVPEGQAYMKALTTGDTSGIGQDVALPGPTEDGQQLTGRMQPDNLKEILAAKAKILREIDDEFRLGKDYKDVAEGRRTELGNQVGRGMVGGAIKTEDAGEQIAALEGKAVDPATAEAKRAALEAKAERDRAAAKKDNRTDPNLRASGRGAGAGGAPAADKSLAKQIEGITSRIGSLRQQQAKAESEAMGERGKANVRNSYAGQISALEAERSTLQASLARGGKGADNARPTGAIKPGETRAYGTSKVTRLN